MINTPFLYFIYGDESFSIEEEIRAVKARFPHFQPEEFSGKFELKELMDAVNTMGLFSQGKLLFLKNPWLLTETLTDTDFKAFQEICIAAQTNQVVMIMASLDQTVDQRKKQITFLKKSAVCKEFKSFKDWEQDKVLQWIRQRITAKGKKIDQDALIMLEQTGGTNLRHLDREIEKLITYVREKPVITEADIQAVTVGSGGTTFQFNEAMKSRQLRETMAFLEDLFENGEDPIRLFGLVAANLRLYFQLLSMAKEKRSMADIARALGKNEYYLSKVYQSVRQHYSLEGLAASYHALQQKDLEIKTGKLAPKRAVELAVIAILAPPQVKATV